MFGYEKLPVIAPAWLPALSKISVRILCAPEGIQTQKSINVRKEAEIQQTEKWESTDSPAEREKINYLPFGADLRVPEIAVPAKPTRTKFKFGEDQHFLHDPSSVTRQILAQKTSSACQTGQGYCKVLK